MLRRKRQSEVIPGQPAGYMEYQGGYIVHPYDALIRRTIQQDRVRVLSLAGDVGKEGGVAG